MFPLAYWNWREAFSQDSPLEVLALGVNLSLVVEGAQLSHQIGGVLRRVHRQRLGDDEEGAGELCDGQLLPGALVVGEGRAAVPTLKREDEKRYDRAAAFGTSRALLTMLVA